MQDKKPRRLILLIFSILAFVAVLILVLFLQQPEPPVAPAQNVEKTTPKPGNQFLNLLAAKGKRLPCPRCGNTDADHVHPSARQEFTPDAALVRQLNEPTQWKPAPEPPAGTFPTLTAVEDGFADWEGQIDAAFRAREVELGELLTSGEPLEKGLRFQLPLFDDAVYDAVVYDSLQNVNGTISTTGRVDGSLAARAVIAYTGGQLRARIIDPDKQRTFAIHYNHDDGKHYALELDRTILNELERCHVTDDGTYHRDVQASLDEPQASGGNDAPLIGTPLAMDESIAVDVVDIMVVYPESVRISAGSTENIQNVAAQGIAFANDAHQGLRPADSPHTRTGIYMNLIHAGEFVGYTDTGNLSTELDRLTNSSDGFIDEAHTWRDTYGADFISMMCASGGGLGWVPGPGSRPNSSFNTNGWGAFSSYTPAHEIGHNMALNHSKFQVSNASGNGHNIDGQYATAWHWHPSNDVGQSGRVSVMSYNSTFDSGTSGPTHNNHTDVGQFSNSEVNDPNWGVPMGLGTEANSTYLLRAQSAIYAAYRTRSFPNNSIDIRHPDGGLGYSPGELIAILWDSNGVTGNVDIELLKGGSVDSAIAMNTHNDGVYTWTIPGGQAAGNDYKIRITSRNEAISDDSDFDFYVGSFQVAYSAGNNGTIAGITSQIVAAGGSSTAVAANPDPGHFFDSWSDGQPDNPRTDVNVTDNINVTANFIAGYLIYADDLNTNPGYTITGGEWEFGSPPANNGNYGPQSANSGTNIYDTDLDNRSTTTNNLTSIAIDCSAFENVQLKFASWFSIGNGYSARIQVSNTGTADGDFTDVLVIQDYNLERGWSFRTVDISALADGQSTVYIRWRHQDDGGGGNFSGLAIDDIKIWGDLAKKVLYSTTTFTEALANDGSINNAATLTLNVETFTGSNGEDFLSNGKASITNLPAGLGATLIRNSATQATLTLTGNASNHEGANDVNNLTLTFNDSAFTGGDASLVRDSNRNDLAIDFFSAIDVTSPNGEEFYSAGETVTITWDTILGGNVQIDLYNGAVFDSAIVATTANDGSYDWTIPGGQTLGSNYLVRITSLAGGGEFDDSDNTFSISTVENFYEALVDDQAPVPAWTLNGDWAFGVPAGNNEDPSSGNTGSNVIGYNLNGRYSSNMGETFATTPAIDCSDYVDIQLSFYRWLGVEDSDWDHAYVRVSNDNTNWTELYQNPSSTIRENSWTQVTYDISAVADGQSTVYVRWVMGSSDGSVEYAGWNVDDVTLSGRLTSLNGKVAFAANNFNISENAGPATITVNRVNGSVGAISVNYATSHGTANGSDYTTASGTLNWPDGDGDPKTFTVPLTNDSDDEPNETVNLTLSSPTQTTIIGDNPATLTIVNDDNVAPVVNAGPDQTVFIADQAMWTPAETTTALWLDADDTDRVILNGATVSQWQDKSGNNRHASQASDAAQPTDTAGGLNGKHVLRFDGSNDYFDVDLNFLAGQSHSAFVVLKSMTSYNNIYGAASGGGGNQSLHVGFSNNTSYRMNYWGHDWYGTVSGNFDNTGSIVNYVWDVGSPKQILANGKNEGTGHNAQAIGTMSGGGRISNVTGHGFLGADIAEIIICTGTLTPAERETFEGYLAHKWGLTDNLPGGHTYKSEAPGSPVAIATLDGTVDDPPLESFTTQWTQFSGPTSNEFDDDTAIDTNATFTQAGVYTLRLTADDGFATSFDDVIITVELASAAGALSFDAANFDVDEDAGTATITVNRTGGSIGAISVDYATSNGSATQPGDYTSTSGTLNWADGDATSKTFTVTIVDDADIEGAETINLTLSNPTIASIGGTNPATLTILDNDNTPPSSNAGIDQNVNLLATAGTPVAGADINLDASLDDGLNTIWEDQTGLWSLNLDAPVAFVANAGSLLPGITSAYNFPGGTTGAEGAEGPSLTTQSGANLQPISLEIWFKPDASGSYPANGQVLWESGGGTGLGIFYRDGFVETAHDSDEFQLSADVSALTGEFIQVVVTHDTASTTDNFNLYINGVWQAGASIDETDLSGSDNAGLGSRGGTNVGGAGGGDAGTESFDGLIAIFRSYHNQILDPVEIRTNYHAVAGEYVTVNLDGTASDGDGDPFTTAWTITSGPGIVDLGDDTAVDTTATFYTAGTYVLRLTVDDTLDQTIDECTIIVGPVPTYAVTYDANSATGGSLPGDQTKREDIDLTLRSNSGGLLRTGYTYAGWNTASDGTGTDYAEGVTYTTNAILPLFAKWTANNYTVTLDRQSGSGGSASVVATYDAAMPVASAPTRTGYTFGGYYSATNGSGTQYYTNAMASATNWDVATDTTLYAHWTANTYTVTFDENGGTAASPADKTVTYDATYGALATTSRTGYTFNGWFTAPTGGSEVTAATTVAITGPQTLYAQWTANTYTVTFDENGGAAPSPADKSVTYDATYGALATTSRTGYTFNGWFTAPTGGSEITAATTVAITAPQTLYAQWTANTYTVTFDENGGTAPSPADKSVTYDATYGALATTSRTGYSFDGWFTAPTGGAQITAATTVAITGPQTLYAQWTANTYTVTFDENGGSAPSPADKSVTYDATYGALATTTRTGYTFNGWFTAPTGGTLITSGTTVAITGPQTLHAQWTINVYTVTFQTDGTTGASITGDTSQNVTYNTDASEVTANTPISHNFTGWSGDYVSASPTITVTNVTADMTITADYAIKQYNVDFVVGDNGSHTGGGALNQTIDYGSDATAPTITADPGYQFTGWDIAFNNVTSDLTVTAQYSIYVVVDDETPTIAEGSFAVVQVKLSGQPTGDVIVTVSRSDGDTDITIAPGDTSLTFTTLNWDDYQTVTLNAAEDPDITDDTATIDFDADAANVADAQIIATEDDDAVTLTVQAGAGGSVTPQGVVDPDEGPFDLEASAAAGYTFANWSTNDGSIADVNAPTTEIDGFTGDTLVTATFNLNVVEIDLTSSSVTIPEGSTAGFQVKLSAQPTASTTVTVVHQSGDGSITVDLGDTLTFTTANWNTYQPVTLGAGEDGDVNNGSATIRLTASGGASATTDVTATEQDDDFTLTVSAGVGGIASGGGIKDQDNTPYDIDATPNAGYYFVNWTGDVTGIADANDPTTTINVAVDASVQANFALNDVAVLTDLNSIIVPEGGTNTFRVKLSNQPAGNVSVVVGYQSGDADLSATGGTNLTFTTANWDTYQTVTVSAAEDNSDVTDGSAFIFCNGSGSVTDKTVTATENDDDFTLVTNSSSGGSASGGGIKDPAAGTYAITATPAPGFYFVDWTGDDVTGVAAVNAASTTITTSVDTTIQANFLPNGVAVIADQGSIAIPEGGTNTFRVKLSNQPTGEVIVSLSVSSGDSDVTIQSASTLIFNTTTWDDYQTVTLAAAEDNADTANGAATITLDANGTVTDSTLTANEIDDDFTLTVSAGTGGSAGTSGTYDVDSGAIDLTATPAAGYTFLEWTGDLAGVANVNAAPTTITTAVDASVQANFLRNTVAVVTDQNSLIVNENDTNTFQVKLSAQPVGDVVVAVTRASGDTSLSVQSGGSLTFTTANWDTYQTVTLAAAPDNTDVIDGSATFSCTPDDLNVATKNVTANENDDDFILTVNAGIGGSGSGGGVKDPTDAPFTITATPAAGYTFLNWSGDTGSVDNVNTAVADVTAISADTTVQANFTKNGVAVITSSDNLTVGEGSSNTFTVALSAQPTTTITVAVSRTAGDTDLAVTGGASLSFTTANWDTPQTVTITAAEDVDVTNGSATITLDADDADVTDKSVNATEDDDAVTLTVVASPAPAAGVSGSATVDPDEGPHSIAATPNPGYTFTGWSSNNGSALDDANALTTTIDALTVNTTATANFTLNSVAVVTNLNAVSVPEGGTADVLVKLSAQPTASVTVSNALTGDADLSISAGGNLTFTTANWDDYQTVTLAAQEDNADVANGSATLNFDASGSVTDKSITATEDDDDFILTVNTSGGGTVSGGGIKDPDNAPYNIFANQATGFTFVGWTGENTNVLDVNDPSTTINVTTTTTVTADFVANGVAVITEVGDVDVDEGDVASFRVRLSAEPQGPVAVSLAIAGDADLTITSAATLNFSTTNWNDYQTISLAAAEDDADVDNGSATITLDADGDVADSSIPVNEVDDDYLLTVNAGANGTAGTTGIYDVDTGAIAITATPDDGYYFLEWTGDVATITPDNASIQPGGAATIQANFALNDVDVLTNVATVNPAEGGNADFTVTLSDQPTGDVIVSISRTAGDTDLTIAAPASAQLTFTTTDWNDPQSVTIAAAEDDADVDNDAATFTLDADDTNVTDTTIIATEDDDDFTLTVLAGTGGSVTGGGIKDPAAGTYDVTATAAAGYVFNAWTGDVGLVDAPNATDTFITASADASVTATFTRNNVVVLTDQAALTVAEGAGNSFQVKLSAQPVATVTVDVSNSGPDGDISISSGSSLIFTTSNWDTYQTVSLAAAEDADVADGTAVIACDANDPFVTDAAVTVTEDDDAVTLTVAAGTGGTTNSQGLVDPEGGPFAISATAGDGYYFVNWSATGGAIANANAAGTTIDALPGDVTVTANFALNFVDLDVSPTSIVVAESGTNTFDVRLTDQPASDVTVDLSRLSGDADLTVASATTLTFTTANWDSYQTVTVAAAADVDAFDGTATFGLDASYVHQTDWQRLVIATEDDALEQPAIVAESANVTIPEGSSATARIRLNARPQENVIVTPTFAGSNGFSLTGATSLTFTTANWDTYQDLAVGSAEDGDIADNTGTLNLTGANLDALALNLTQTDDDFTLTLVVGAGGDSVSGDGIKDPEDSPYEISAIPAEGYDFVNWTVTAGSASFDDANSPTTEVTAAADATVQANFAIKTYPINYHANNATSGSIPASQTKIHFQALSLQTNSGGLARTGYLFTGWNTASDGSGDNYAEGADYLANEAATLYARWVADSLVVTIVADSVSETAGAAATTATVSRTDTEGQVTVTLESSDLSEITVPTSVIIAAGNTTSAPFPLTAVDDDLFDGTVSVTITASAPAFNTGTDTVDVTDYEELAVSISQSTLAENSESATLTVTRTDPAAELVVTLLADDATELSVPANLTIPAGDLAASTTITTVDDNLLDGPQSVAISANATGHVGDATNLTVTDYETFNIVIDPDAISEGGGPAAATATISRTNIDDPVLPEITITLASSNTGEATVPASVTLLLGQVSTTFPIDAINEELADGAQIVTISATADDYVSGNQPLTVYDNEALEITLSASSIPENAGAGALTASISRGPGNDADPIEILISGGDNSELIVPSSVTIPALQASTTFTIDIVDDDDLDGDQLITFTTSTPDAEYEDGQFSVTVTDYEVLTVTVDIDEFAETAGNDVATGTVYRSTINQLEESLKVTLTSNDTSEIAVPDFVTIPAFQTSATFTINAVDDALLDGTQNPAVIASAAGFFDGQSTFNVTDVETLLLTINASSVREDAGAAATTATIRRSNVQGLGEPLQVTLSSSDDSEITVPVTVEIPVNRASVDFDLAAVDDDLFDGTQPVIITASADGYAAPATDTINIEDHEILTLVLHTDTIPEDAGTGAVSATVTRSSAGASAPALSVTISTSDDTEATAPATVVIPAGQASVDFTIDAVDDAKLDGEQTVTFSASAPPFAIATADLKVTDVEFLTVSFDVNPVSEDAGRRATNLTVTRSNVDDIGSVLQVSLHNSDTSEAIGSTVVNIAAGDASGSTAVNARDDDLLDGPQIVTFTASAFGYSDAIGLLTVDDAEELTLTINDDAMSEFGGSSSLTVTRSNEDNLEQPLVVDLTSLDESEVSVPATITILANETTASIGFNAVDDLLLDATQIAMVTASAAGYASASDTIEVTDAETLNVIFQSASIPENGGVAAGSVLITRSNVDNLELPLDVTVSHDDGSEIAIPNTLTIPAGKSSEIFPIDAVDDNLLDGTQTVQATVSAAGYTGNNDSISVTDYEYITVTIADSSVREDAGDAATTATIARSNVDDPDLPALDVHLASDNLDAATVDAAVTIPAGQITATVDLNAVDDAFLDGSQFATITATTTNYFAGSDVLEVTDAEQILLSLSTATIREDAGTAATTLTVTRTSTADTSLAVTVMLATDDTSEAVIAESVEIPSGAASVDITIDAVDDAIVDGPQSVGVTASAAGFEAGAISLSVTDDALTIVTAAAPADSGTQTGDGIVDPDAGPFAITTVAAVGYTFRYWTTSGGTLADENSPDATIDDLVADSTTVTANYNAVPVGTDDTYSVDEDDSITINTDNGVTANDPDDEDDSLTVTLASPVSHGVLTLNADGSFNYEPVADFFGTDSFSYRVADPYGQALADATVTITVLPQPDKAIIDLFAIDDPEGTHAGITRTAEVLVTLVSSDVDQHDATHWYLSTDDTPPTAGSDGWLATLPTTFTLPASGLNTVYAWVKDPQDVVSDAASATIDFIPSNDFTFTIDAGTPTAEEATVGIWSEAAADTIEPTIDQTASAGARLWLTDVYADASTLLATDYRPPATNQYWRLHVNPVDGPVELSWALGAIAADHAIMLLPLKHEIAAGEAINLSVDTSVTVTTATTYLVAYGPLLERTFQLQKGWNWLTMPLIGNVDFEAVLSHPGGSHILPHRWRFLANGQLSAHSGNLLAENSVLVFAPTATTSLSFSGIRPDGILPVGPGWRIVCLPDEIPVGSAKHTEIHRYQLLYVWNPDIRQYTRLSKDEKIPADKSVLTKPNNWDSWQDLNFSLSKPFYYQY